MSDNETGGIGRLFGRRRQDARLAAIHELLVRLDAAIVVRDPGTARSVDAYDGLRKQVVAAAGERRRLLVILSEMAEAVRLGQDQETLRSKVDEWMLQAQLVMVDDPTLTDAFEAVGETAGPSLVTKPAYVDGATGALIRRGVIERDTAPTTTQEGGN